MQSIKTNVKTSEAKVAPHAALQVFAKAGMTASKAAVFLAASGCSYLVIATLGQPKDKAITVADATKTMRELLESNKADGVGNEMLKRYVQVAKELFGKFSDDGKYNARVQKLLKTGDASKCADMVATYVSRDLGADSLNKLRKALGINTGHAPAQGATKPEERIATAIETVSKKKDAKTGKMVATNTPAAVLKNVANAVVGDSAPLALAKESMARYFRRDAEHIDVDAVTALIKWLNSALDAKLEEAKPVKAKASPRKAKPAKVETKAAPVATTA